VGEDGTGKARQVLAEAPGAAEMALWGSDRAHRVHAAAEAVDRLPGIADPDRGPVLGLEDGQGHRVGVLRLIDIEHCKGRTESGSPADCVMSVPRQAARSTRLRSRLKPARPYMVRLIVFSRLI
jgi:hypothetical protein